MQDATTYIARATEALAAGFTSEAARKRAQEDVNRAWDCVRDGICEEICAKTGWSNVDLWNSELDMPLYVHQAAKKLKKAFAELGVESARSGLDLVDLRDKIKAAPLAKSEREIKKEQQEKLQAAARNEEVRAFMETHVRPELERMHRDRLTARVDRLAEIYGEAFESVDSDFQRLKAIAEVVKTRSIRPTAKEVRSSSADILSTMRAYHRNPAAIIKAAYAQAQAEVDAFAPKFELKLGAGFKVSSAGGSDGRWVISGSRNGHAVTIEQGVTFNVSPLGKFFVQFPARLYIDGRFVSENEYVKFFEAA